jgi:hypothetical protein
MNRHENWPDRSQSLNSCFVKTAAIFRRIDPPRYFIPNRRFLSGKAPSRLNGVMSNDHGRHSIIRARSGLGPCPSCGKPFGSDVAGARQRQVDYRALAVRRAHSFPACARSPRSPMRHRRSARLSTVRCCGMTYRQGFAAAAPGAADHSLVRASIDRGSCWRLRPKRILR